MPLSFFYIKKILKGEFILNDKAKIEVLKEEIKKLQDENEKLKGELVFYQDEERQAFNKAKELIVQCENVKSMYEEAIEYAKDAEQEYKCLINEVNENSKKYNKKMNCFFKELKKIDKHKR